MRIVKLPLSPVEPDAPCVILASGPYSVRTGFSYFGGAVLAAAPFSASRELVAIDAPQPEGEGSIPPRWKVLTESPEDR